MMFELEIALHSFGKFSMQKGTIPGKSMLLH